MAAAKKTAKKKTRRKHHTRRWALRRSPEAMRWRLWCHDFDTILHGLVRNASIVEMAPEAIVKLAEGFADAITETQDRRRPKKLAAEDDWR